MYQEKNHKNVNYCLFLKNFIKYQKDNNKMYYLLDAKIPFFAFCNLAHKLQLFF